MNKRKWITIASAVVASIGLGVSTTNSTMLPTNNIVEAKTKSKAKAYKHSITYSNSKGKMTINKIEGYKMLDYDGDFSNWTTIVYGKFTNKSKHNVNPLDFFADHFRVFQVTKTQWRDIDPEGPITDAPTEKINMLGEDGDTAVRPHKTVTVAYQGDEIRKLKKGQRFTVRAYNDAYSSRRKKLASKNFYLKKVPSTMNYYDREEYDD